MTVWSSKLTSSQDSPTTSPRRSPSVVQRIIAHSMLSAGSSLPISSWGHLSAPAGLRGPSRHDRPGWEPEGPRDLAGRLAEAEQPQRLGPGLLGVAGVLGAPAGPGDPRRLDRQAPRRGPPSPRPRASGGTARPTACSRRSGSAPPPTSSSRRTPYPRLYSMQPPLRPARPVQLFAAAPDAHCLGLDGGLLELLNLGIVEHAENAAGGTGA